MLTQCPHCETVFRVGAEQLNSAGGRVRCGQCAGVFDAHAHVYDSISPGEAAALEPSVASAGARAAGAMDSGAGQWPAADDEATPYINIAAPRDGEHWQPEQTAVTRASADHDDIESSAVTDSPAATRAPVIAPLDVHAADLLADELRPPVPAAPAHRLRWFALALLLISSLGAQYLYFARADLLQYPALRPVLQRICVPLGCRLPLRHVPARIELLSRDVISHPRIPGALLINATFVNRADFVQAYPILEISLSGDSGAVVAMRRFRPEEYLPPGVAVAAGLAPGVPVHVVLEVAEPRRPAASFQFEFL